MLVKYKQMAKLRDQNNMAVQRISEVRAVVVRSAVMGHGKCGNEPAGSVHLRGISCLAEELWASQEGLRTMEIVCQLTFWCRNYFFNFITPCV